MCGIAGIWKKEGQKLEESSLSRFTDSISHRGPDGGGYKIFQDSLGLGHRRLSILDTSHLADQPMQLQGHGLHIAYNGEVFNFIEIRKELEKEGWKFISESDTEVILAAYKEWGMDAFHRFNGMWAMAIWDEEKSELLLSRDRFGIKPLYYLDNNEMLAWASETLAFRSLEGFQLQVDERLLEIAKVDTYALEGKGHSIFKDVKQLLPGHFIRLKAGQPADQKRWYHILNHEIEVPSSYEGQTFEFRRIFKDACKLRMRSDVTLATALSGGVDSTAVYSMVHELMAEHVAERSPADWQRAFVAVFPGTDQDERRYAEEAVSYTKGQAEYIEQDLKDLPQRILHSTQHFNNLSSTPILALMGVYEGMRKHGVTVSLDGHGVDEMLYGYRNMVYEGMEYHKWNGGKAEAEATKRVLVEMYAEEMRSKKEKAFQEDIESAFQRRSSLIHKAGRLWKNGNGPRPLEVGDLVASLSDKPYDFSGKNTFDRMVYEEFFLRTLPSLLRNFDHAAMSSSIEIRMPFMDYRLVEMAFSLPYSSKIGGGYTKRILRDAMKGYMPETIRTRTFKLGLAAPTKDWFSGPLKEFLGDQLDSHGFKEHALIRSTQLSEFKNLQSKGDWNKYEAAQMWIALNAHLIHSEHG